MHRPPRRAAVAHNAALVEQSSQQHAETAGLRRSRRRSTRGTGTTAGEQRRQRSGDALPNGEAGEVGGDAVDKGLEVEFAGVDELDERVLHGLERLGRHLLGGARRVRRFLGIAAQRPGDAVLPVAAGVERPIGRRFRLA